METGNGGFEDLSLNASRRVELQALRENLNARIAEGRGNDLSFDYLWPDGDDRASADPLASIYGERHTGVSVFNVPTSGLSANNRLGLVVDPDLEGEASGVGLRVKANLVGLGLFAHEEDGEVVDDGDGVDEGEMVDEGKRDATPEEIVDEISMSGARVIEPILRKGRKGLEPDQVWELSNLSASRRNFIRQLRRQSPKNMD